MYGLNRIRTGVNFPHWSSLAIVRETHYTSRFPKKRIQDTGLAKGMIKT